MLEFSGGLAMAQNETKVPVRGEKGETSTAVQEWWPFTSLHREIDRLFEDFFRWRLPSGRHFDVEPLKRMRMGPNPAVDITENEKAYELTADLPGLEEKNIDLKVANGGLTIKGEKKEETEEEGKDYHLSERHFGSFQRYFRLPDTVDVEKIAATFKNGVLKVTLPKKLDAQKSEKKIEIKPVR
jgi:HSP20 family protein